MSPDISPGVLVERLEPGIVAVVLNRPRRKNALSQAVVTELHQVFDEIANDRTTRAVVLTGAGGSFCAGADIKGDGSLPPGADGMAPIPLTLTAQKHIASLNEKIHRLRQPVIAAVDGVAVGGGFGLALACDIRYASTRASFGAVFIKLGISGCDVGVSYFLPRMVGAARSAELLLTGRIFDAAEAQRMGLVLDVVSPDELMAKAVETARRIAEHSPFAVWMTKETMWRTVDAPSLGHAVDLENRTQVMCTATGEMYEAFGSMAEGGRQVWRDL